MTEKKLALHYDLSEWEAGEDHPGAYIKVRAWDDEGHEVSIITNRDGEGRFIEVWEAGSKSYQQVDGTCQYALGDTSAKIKYQLREQYILRSSLGWE